MIEVALGGKAVTRTVEGRERYPVRVRYARDFRVEEESIRRILVSSGGMDSTAETTEGVFYHGEAMSQPKGASGDPLVPEDIGHMAATRLMEQIYRVDVLTSIIFYYSFTNSRSFEAEISRNFCRVNGTDFLQFSYSREAQWMALPKC